VAINLKEIDPDTLYDTAEAAKKINTTAGNLCNLRTKGKPPEYIRAGGRIYYTGKALLERLGVS